MTNAAATWVSETRDRIRDLQNGLLDMAAWAAESSADENARELLLLPFREQLVDQLYRHCPIQVLYALPNAQVRLDRHDSPAARLTALPRRNLLSYDAHIAFENLFKTGIYP